MSITNISRVCGVKVTHQILVLIFQVRILADLQKFRNFFKKNRNKDINFLERVGGLKKHRQKCLEGFSKSSRCKNGRNWLSFHWNDRTDFNFILAVNKRRNFSFIQSVRQPFRKKLISVCRFFERCLKVWSRILKELLLF